jgi:phage/plasmid-associated DNA primase
MSSATGLATSVQSAFVDLFDDSKPCKTSLYHFMNRFALSELDTGAKPNFISLTPEYRKRFFVPDRDISNMMKLLNVCMNEGIVNHFYELQDSNESLDEYGNAVPGSSGLLFEFQFKTVHETIEFDTIVPTFIRVLFEDILSKHLDFPPGEEEKHFCFYLKTVPVYDESSLEYHATFRIVIPTIMVDSETRFFIQRRVWRSKKIIDKFNMLLQYPLQKCLIPAMRTAPVSLLGSRHPDKLATLQFKSAFPIRTIKGVSIADTAAIDKSSFTSLINDISVVHPSEGSQVVKRDYFLKEKSFEQMEQEMDDKQLFSMAYDEAFSTYSQMLVYDDEIEHIHAMIEFLDPSRFESVDACVEIIRSLASEPLRYKCIAVMAIKDHNKFVKDLDGEKCPITWEEFGNHWDEAINKSQSTAVNGSTRAQYSASAIQYWATCDSPSKVHRYINAMVRKLMIRDIRHPLVRGRINHSQMASYLHFMFRNIYITAQGAPKSPADWYEFVTPITKDIEPGQIYKWRRVGAQPDRLSIYMTSEFKDIATSIFTDMNALCIQSDESQKPDARTKYIMDLSAQYFRAIQLVFSNSNKRSIIDEATSLFRKNYFVKQLDRTPHVLGVGNGVLEFNGADVRLLDYYHTYPISLFTDTKYVPYDKDSEFVKTIYRMLRSMVPDDESDALDFLLYYFSTSLDSMPKESLFLIVHGGGCHARDTPIRMYNGSIKLVQDVELGDRLMGDDNTIRTVQELFRGNDDMVRIVPTKGESFEVNKDHVLSLTFADVSSVRKCANRDNSTYMARWYEHNAINQPNQKSKEFPTQAAARAYLHELQACDTTVVKQGDIIDIMVKDLMKWALWWIQKSNVMLYKSSGVEYAEKRLVVEPYAFGHGIGNKRMPTDFKTGSTAQRLELLAGVLDSIGTYQESTNRYEIAMKSDVLSDDCVDLVRSLGLACYKTTVYKACVTGREDLNDGSYYRMEIYGSGIEKIPCKIAHKRAMPHEGGGNALATSFAIQEIGTGDYYGFELDGNHRYLTGDHCVHHNSNGKSVLMELFRRTLGELYVRKMPLSFITDQNRTSSSSADPAMMELKNARMVYYSESDRNEKVNVAKVKEITGGESLSGRQLYKEQENFTANCNHIVTTNHRFIIETTEHAVWRRFMSYKFKICFKIKCDPNEPNERPRDPELIDKIKADKRYQEAFLSILIHYRSKLYAHFGGQILRVPHPTIEKETEEYRQSEDIYQRFIMNNVYHCKGMDIAMDDFVVRFREYYRHEGGGQYNGKSEDLLHIFRNSLLSGHIKFHTGKYYLQGFHVPTHGEKAPGGCVVYHEWIKHAKANA